MKKRLLGVLLALVALGAMAGSAFAATSWDITLSIDVAGTPQTLVVKMPAASDDKAFLSGDIDADTLVASKDSAIAATGITVSSDKITFSGSSTASADLTATWIISGDAGEKLTNNSTTISETTTFYLQITVSGDALSPALGIEAGKDGTLLVSVKVTVDDGSSDDGGSVTPTDPVQEALNTNFPAVTMESATTTMTDGLSSLFGGNITFTDLSSVTVLSGQTKATSFDQTVVSNSASLTSTQTVKAVLPRVTISAADANKYFAFALALVKAANADLDLYLAAASTNPYSASVSAVEIAAGTLCDAKFVDANGKELTTSASYNGKVGVGSQLMAGTFVPYIVQETTSTQDDNTTSPKSGNSGCDMGMGSLALLLAAALPLLRKVR